MTKQKKILFGH